MTDPKRIDPQLHNPEECRLSKATAGTILTSLSAAKKFLAPEHLNDFEVFRAMSIMTEIAMSETEPFNDRFPWHGTTPPPYPHPDWN